MRVEDLITPTCRQCGEEAVIRQFGWDKETGNFVMIVQCLDCQALYWAAIPAAEQVERLFGALPTLLTRPEPKSRGLDNGYV